jgi:hypothetical protein
VKEEAKDDDVEGKERDGGKIINIVNDRQRSGPLIN